MASWLTRILPSSITGTQQVSPVKSEPFNGGAQAAEMTAKTDGDPRYAQPHSSGIHGAVSGTGENGRHRLDMYM